jgi:hypothetical protein
MSRKFADQFDGINWRKPKASGAQALIRLAIYGPTKQVAEKVRTEQESNTSGAKVSA